LAYKLQECGKHLVVIDRWFPSTKRCSRCGSVKEEIGLSERIYSCEQCGFQADRDHNAAVNIRDEGRRIFLLTG
ncbi:MAG: transposase, partial [Symbiobacteriaceae bacterium]|nr:transposase [Symbiobacteriaceae bacterium]